MISGRDSKGRFANGNTLGVSFKEQKELKKILYDIAKGDFKEIGRVLVEESKNGSVPHMTLLFTYLIKKADNEKDNIDDFFEEEILEKLDTPEKREQAAFIFKKAMEDIENLVNS